MTRRTNMLSMESLEDRKLMCCDWFAADFGGVRPDADFIATDYRQAVSLDHFGDTPSGAIDPGAVDTGFSTAVSLDQLGDTPSGAIGPGAVDTGFSTAVSLDHFGDTPSGAIDPGAVDNVFSTY